MSTRRRSPLSPLKSTGNSILELARSHDLFKPWHPPSRCIDPPSPGLIKLFSLHFSSLQSESRLSRKSRASKPREPSPGTQEPQSLANHPCRYLDRIDLRPKDQVRLSPKAKKTSSDRKSKKRIPPPPSRQPTQLDFNPLKRMKMPSSPSPPNAVPAKPAPSKDFNHRLPRPPLPSGTQPRLSTSPMLV